MFIESKTAKGIQTIPIETRLLTERSVFLTGEINMVTALETVKQILYLIREDPGKKIDLLLSSPGGEVNAGLLLYDMLTGISDTVIRTICMGKAYSMGALILAAGQKGRRYILPNSEVMIHEPLISSGVGGSSSSVKSISDSLWETRKHLNTILSKHTGKPVKQIEKATSYDHYFSATEAVKFGLADHVISFSEIMKTETEVAM